MIRIPVSDMPRLKLILIGTATKRERKAAFNRVASAVGALFSLPKSSITDVSLGLDAQGVEWLYVHQRDTAVVTTVSGNAPSAHP
jgi:hypothetical protein